MAKTFTSNWTTKTGLNLDSQYNLSKRDVHRAREAFRDAADSNMEIEQASLDALLQELGLRLSPDAFARPWLQREQTRQRRQRRQRWQRWQRRCRAWRCD